VGAELVIFDCDGVLVDSARISLRIQAEWITALGLPTSYEDCVRDYLGLGMPATLRPARRSPAGATAFTAMAELPALASTSA
jgi:beta-phosphoglucomutase-like phosphatase (HAD superfamily)